MSRLVLRYDDSVACWIDKEGNAWTIAVVASVVRAARDANGTTRCTICGRDQKTDKRRRTHMLNAKCRRKNRRA